MSALGWSRLGLIDHNYDFWFCCSTSHRLVQGAPLNQFILHTFRCLWERPYFSVTTRISRLTSKFSVLNMQSVIYFFLFYKNCGSFWWRYQNLRCTLWCFIWMPEENRIKQGLVVMLGIERERYFKQHAFMTTYLLDFLKVDLSMRTY